jgi:integrase
VYTVAEWGAEWLDERERTGYRHVQDDRRRWRKHVAHHTIAQLQLADVAEPDAREWLHDLLVTKKRGRPLAANTCRNALNLLRASFTDACEAGVIESNPLHGLKVPRARSARTYETWTVLTVAEQQAVLRHIPDPMCRRFASFAIGSGLSRGEQVSLRRKHIGLSIDMPSVTVVFGGADGRRALRPRVVPLFGLALDAVREQLAVLSSKPSALVWPVKKMPLSGWPAWVGAAGITRPVRWHDLRHTCAASLVSGWWGRRWSLEEVRELLGHSSISITERYAHFAKNVLANAARETMAAQAQGPKGLLQ